MDLSALSHIYAQVPALMLVLARIGALFAAAPLVGGPYAPATVKALLAMAVGLILLPGIDAPVVILNGGFILQIAREFLLGLSLGFLMNLYFQGVKMGGELINRHAGFSAAENFDPEADIGAGPMGDLLHLALVLLFFAVDGHHLFLAVLAKSFTVIPLGGWSMSPQVQDVLWRSVADSWRIALLISFPVLSAIMAITVAEGVITRAVPQINVMHLSFAVKIGVSLSVVYAGLPAAVAMLGSVLLTMQTVVWVAMGS